MIGAIDIFDRFTLADVDSDVANDVIEALQGVRFKGAPVTVRLDNGGRRSDDGGRWAPRGDDRYSRFDDDDRGPRR